MINIDEEDMREGYRRRLRVKVTGEVESFFERQRERFVDHPLNGV